MAQAYRWGFDEIRRLTVPQIIMLSHAAHINKRRSDVAMAQEREHPTGVRGQVDSSFHQEDPVWNGKRWSELNSEEMADYIRSGAA